MVEVDSSRRREISNNLPPRAFRPFNSQDRITVFEEGGKIFSWKGSRIADVDERSVTLTSGRVLHFNRPITIEVGSREYPHINVGRTEIHDPNWTC